MKRIFTLFPLVFFLFTNTVFTQNSLQVVNPDWGGWSNGVPGTIEEAEFQIEPKGIYMEVGMFLTFSARETDYVYEDNLEVVFDFNLPSGSIIHDSWLWMDETVIVKADIYDVSQATEIYENIVDRNKDPSLLYRKDNGTYQIRIFPMEGMGTRKVKISYLVPAVWTADQVESWLPLELLKQSHNPLSNLRLVSVADDDWGKPNLSGNAGVEFEKTNDPDMGEIWVADLPASAFNKAIKFRVDSPLSADGVYVSKLEDSADEKFYQLAYLPPSLPVSSNSKNVAVVFDYDPYTSEVLKSDVFDFVQESLLSTLTTGDQLNLTYSNNLNVEMASETWVPGDNATLTQLFSNLSDPIGERSNLIEALTTTIEFVKANGGVGEILLFTNSGNYINANENIQKWLDLIGANEIKVHVINYQTLNYYWNYNWASNKPELYYQNQKLYKDLSLLTGGSFFSAIDYGVDTWEVFTNAVRSLKNSSYVFDLDIEVAGGFSYEPFYQTYLGQSKDPNQPILQVGKYFGDFPSTIDFSAYSDGAFVFDSKTINADEIKESDSLSREIWIGHLIDYMEGSADNGLDIKEVVEVSIKERVLSSHTAFLALEVAQGGEICLDCWYYEEIIIATDEASADQLELSMNASPNPFSEYTQLSLELKGDSKPKDLNAQIFDAFGNLIRTLNVEDLLQSGNTQLTWDGTDANGNKLPSGIYHLVVRTEKEIQTLKLVLIR